jgi:hypothetical protein
VAKTKKVKKSAPAAKKATKKAAPAAKAKSAAKPAAKPAAGKKQSWLTSDGTPAIDRRARELKTFMDAMADGIVEKSELADQEKRLVALLREVEPMLDARTHGRVTELLCELTAYDIMRLLHAMHEARPKSTFRG